MAKLHPKVFSEKRKLFKTGSLHFIIAIAVLFCFSFLVIPSASASKNWEGKWNKAKDDYEELAEQKKPSRKGIFGIRLGSGISKALKNLDKAWDSIDLPDRKHYNNYVKKLNIFKQKEKRYIGELNAEIKSETDKKLKRLLKFLKLTLESIEEDAEENALKYSQLRSRDQKRYFMRINSAYKEVRAFYKKVKGSKSVEHFNKDVASVTNGLIKAIKKLKDSDIVAEDNMALEGSIDELEKWAKGRAVTEDTLKRKLKDFKSTLKTIKDNIDFIKEKHEI